MAYYITYKDAIELFYEKYEMYKRDGIEPKTGEQAETMQTWDTDENELEEGERLNFLLPVINWEIENNQLTTWMRHELYLYYKDYVEGRLNDILAENDREDVIRDLTKYFNIVYPEGLEE